MSRKSPTKQSAKAPVKTAKATPKKTTRKKKPVSTTAPDYIMVNGHVYERLSGSTKEVELDLEEDVMQLVDQHIEDGKYVSRGDAIRDILRRFIEEKGVK